MTAERPTAPAHIVLAWELGHGYGHALPLAALARRLIDQGHAVTVVARDPVRVRQAFADLPVRVLCAPFFPGVIAPAQQQNSLADVIWFDGGGHDAAGFAALFLVWRTLLKLLRADLLIADAAPVALAAARELVPTISYDNGFHSTDTCGWSIFRDWERINAAASEHRAAQLLTHLNDARVAAGLDRVDTLSDGFGADRYLIRFAPELDYAAPRPQARYVGQAVVPGTAPEWPVSAQAHRVFVYVRKAYALTDRVISALVRLQRIDVLCFHDGLTVEQQRPAAHLRYTQTPIDLGELLPQVDAVICHGGGLQALALQYGKPTLALPLHTEQYLSARKAERAGASLVYLARGERPDFLPMIRQLLTLPTLAAGAQAIAAAQRAREPDTLAAVLDVVADLLARSSSE